VLLDIYTKTATGMTNGGKRKYSYENMIKRIVIYL